eukprot:m51a1_g2916 hypothetical protein (322) ;mRNA; f:518287-519309
MKRDRSDSDNADAVAKVLGDMAPQPKRRAHDASGSFSHPQQPAATSSSPADPPHTAAAAQPPQPAQAAEDSAGVEADLRARCARLEDLLGFAVFQARRRYKEYIGAVETPDDDAESSHASSSPEAASDAAEDLEARSQELEREVVSSSIAHYADLLATEAEACRVARRLAMRGRVRRALELARVVRVVSEEVPTEYYVLINALAVIATWPATPRGLRDEISAEVAESPLEEDAAAIMSRGWPSEMATMADTPPTDPYYAEARAEFLSSLGRHEEAIAVAAMASVPMCVLRCQLAASLWEEAVVTVQECIALPQFRANLKQA